jgi:hypothetical protein
MFTSSYPFLTVQQNQHLSVLQARAEARAEYKKQGICTDLFYDDFVAGTSMVKRITIRLNRGIAGHKLIRKFI